MTQETVTIAVDAISGDHGAQVIVPACLSALKKYSDTTLILTGDQKVIEQELQRKQYANDFGDRLQIVHAEEVVDMDDEPTYALRKKRDSSMRVAINLIKENKAIACVSGGNTGALLAISRYVLRTLPGIDRPAIIAMVPTLHGHIYMLDLGANVDSKTEHLVQFAVMGSLLASVVDDLEKPRIALLNVGEESIKGHDQIKVADGILRNSELNYIGYVEGNHLYQQPADVVVTDGFVGNIVLKSMEGTSFFMMELLKKVLLSSQWGRILGSLMKPVLENVKEQVSMKTYNGASLLGLQGIVIKSHGRANADEFENSIRLARKEAFMNVPELLDKQLETMMRKTSP